MAMSALLEHHYMSGSDDVDKPFHRGPPASRRRHEFVEERDDSTTDGVEDNWSSPPTGRRNAAPAQLTDRQKLEYIAKLERLEASEEPMGADVAVPTDNVDPRADHDHPDIHDRTHRWKQRVTSATAALEEDLRQVRDSECTFRPRINRYVPPGAGGVDVTVSDCSDEGSTSGRRREGSVFSRLHRDGSSIRERTQHAREVLKEERDRKCTFKPRTVHSAWTEAVRPRYLDPTAARESTSDAVGSPSVTLHGFRGRGSATMTTKRNDPDVDLTFMPVTNPSRSPFVSEYLRQPVHERLHRSPAPRAEASSERYRATKRSLTPAQQRAFEGRVASDIQKRTQRAQSRQLKLESERPSFTPRTTRYAEMDKLSREERDELVRARQAKLESERRQLELQMTPRASGRFASKESQRMLRERPELQKPLVERYKELAARKKERIDALKKEEEDAERAQVYTAPKGVAKPPPDCDRLPVSRVAKAQHGSWSDFTSYIEDVERKRTESLSEAAAESERARLQGSAELTFHPEVHEAPEYVRQIAQARSLSRADSRHSESRTGQTGHPTARRTSTGAMVLDATPLRYY